MNILQLFQIEFHKFRYNRGMVVLLVIYTILMISAPFLLEGIIKINGKININGEHIYRIMRGIGVFEFPYVWHFTTYVAQWTKIFLLLIVMFMVSSEYTYRTLKQNLIDGLSKKEFILSKFIVVVVIALFSTFLIIVDALYLGFTHTLDTPLGRIITDTLYLLGYFIRILTFFSMGLFFTMLFKRTILAIASMFIWWIIELYLSIFSKSVFFQEYIYPFLPFQAMSSLIKEPFTRFSTKLSMLTGKANMDYSVQFTDVLICCIWISLFIWGSYYILKKRDL